MANPYVIEVTKVQPGDRVKFDDGVYRKVIQVHRGIWRVTLEAEAQASLDCFVGGTVQAHRSSNRKAHNTYNEGSNRQ
ncbi:MAG: hypothetical protein ACYS7Y_36275 [Planctomycetota bacterium]